MADFPHLLPLFLDITFSPAVGSDCLEYSIRWGIFISALRLRNLICPHRRTRVRTRTHTQIFRFFNYKSNRHNENFM